MILNENECEEILELLLSLAIFDMEYNTLKYQDVTDFIDRMLLIIENNKSISESKKLEILENFNFFKANYE